MVLLHQGECANECERIWKNDKFEIRGKTDEFDTIGQKKI